MLINCNECGNEISDKSEKCNNCGCPTQISIEALKKNQLSEKYDELIGDSKTEWPCRECGEPMVQYKKKCPNCGVNYNKKDIEMFSFHMARIWDVERQISDFDKKPNPYDEPLSGNERMRAYLLYFLGFIIALPVVILNTTNFFYYPITIQNAVACFFAAGCIGFGLGNTYRDISRIIPASIFVICVLMGTLYLAFGEYRNGFTFIEYMIYPSQPIFEPIKANDFAIYAHLFAGLVPMFLTGILIAGITKGKDFYDEYQEMDDKDRRWYKIGLFAVIVCVVLYALIF